MIVLALLFGLAATLTFFLAAGLRFEARLALAISVFAIPVAALVAIVIAIGDRPTHGSTVVHVDRQTRRTDQPTGGQRHLEVSTPNGPSDLAAWQAMLDRRCPSNHIAIWMPGRNKADLIDAFLSTLPRPKAAVVRHAAQSWRCAHAEGSGGDSCEVLTDLHGLREAQLLAAFTQYACARVRCSEPAICDGPQREQ
jgi:hypothetical protein